MASCQTSQWVSTAPYVRLTVETQSSTGDKATYYYKLEYIASSAAHTSVNKNWAIKIGSYVDRSGSYGINGKTGTYLIAEGTFTVNKTKSTQIVSFSCSFEFNLTWSDVYKGTLSASGTFSVPTLTTYTITYNANGGTSTPGAQTKWHGLNTPLTTSKPSRIGYTFQGWGTSASDTTVDYASGASYTANANITLYAIWKANTYTVTYNANGGTGAPGSQTKTYGVALTLSNVKPTRDLYTFKGWGTSASATTVVYASGASYTYNAPVTLYAIWELAYVKPRVSNLVITRCDFDGTTNDEGAYALVSFDWGCDKGAVAADILSSDESGNINVYPSSLSGTSDSFREIIGGDFNAEITYNFEIVVTDESGETHVFGTLPSAKFAIDFKAGGKGAAFGKTAELDDVLDIAFKTRFFGGLLPLVLEPETDLNDIRTPNTYTGADLSKNKYVHCPVNSGTFVLVVESCGENGQVRQTYSSCSKIIPERFVRFYYGDTWGDWLWSNTDEVVLYESADGSTETIKLSQTLSAFRYIEIYFTDNNGKTGGYTKVWNPNGKLACLSIVETSSTTSVLQRQTMYTLSGVQMIPSTSIAGYIQFNPSTKVISNAPVGTNYIKIVRVIGRT